VNSADVSGNQTAGLDKNEGRFEVRTTTDSHFGWVRTRLALERTMMAWLRTGVSLIGFGFAIVQFFERLSATPGTRPATYPKAPEYLGLALISCGVLALIVSIWQYRWTVRYMWGPQFRSIAGMRAGVTKEQMQSPVIAIAVLLTAIGLFAFFAVLLRQV
jgi:inner membrane protein YidH